MRNHYTTLFVAGALLFSFQTYASLPACGNANGTDVVETKKRISASELKNNATEVYRSIARDIQSIYGSNVNHTRDIGPSLVFTSCLGFACNTHHIPAIAFSGNASIEQAILNKYGVEASSEKPAAKCDPSKNVNTKTNNNSGGGGSGTGWFAGATPWAGTVWVNPDALPNGTVTTEEVK